MGVMAMNEHSLYRPEVDNPTPRCVGCGRRPEEIHEYQQLAQVEGYSSPDVAVRCEEGTYNCRNGHFYCTECYIKAGMPLGKVP